MTIFAGKILAALCRCLTADEIEASARYFATQPPALRDGLMKWGLYKVVLLSADIYSRFPRLTSDFQEFDEFVREHERRFAPELVPVEDGDPDLSVEDKTMFLLLS